LAVPQGLDLNRMTLQSGVPKTPKTPITCLLLTRFTKFHKLASQPIEFS
jgi:hypothetical protein